MKEWTCWASRKTWSQGRGSKISARLQDFREAPRFPRGSPDSINCPATFIITVSSGFCCSEGSTNKIVFVFLQKLSKH